MLSANIKKDKNDFTSHFPSNLIAHLKKKLVLVKIKIMW